MCAGYLLFQHLDRPERRAGGGSRPGRMVLSQPRQPFQQQRELVPGRTAGHRHQQRQWRRFHLCDRHQRHVRHRQARHRHADPQRRNNYSGRTTVSGGTLSISSDSNLGNPTYGLTLDGGTLETTAGITSSRTITVGSGGGTVEADECTNTFSGPVSGSNTLTITGNVGWVDLPIPPTSAAAFQFLTAQPCNWATRAAPCLTA